jgi:glycosyltransferase involved in cell wall biosynthesis
MSEFHSNNCRRVSIALPDLRGGGAERVNMELALEFCSRGYPVDLVLMRAEVEILELVPDSARVVEVRDVAALATAMREPLEAAHDRAPLRRRAATLSVDRAADRYLELMFPGESPGDQLQPNCAKGVG